MNTTTAFTRYLGPLLIMTSLGCGNAGATKARSSATSVSKRADAPPTEAASSNSSSGAAWNPGRFTERVANDLRQKLKKAQVTVVEPLKLAIDLGDGKKVEANLGRPWGSCERDAAECERAAKEFVDGVMSAVDDAAPLEADSLRVVLRTREEVQAARERSPTIVVEPWLDELQIVLVFDLPRTTKMALESDLTELKLERGKAFELARENTARVVAGELPEDMGPAHAFSGNAYEASRLLAGTDWAAIAKTVKGDLLVAAPARETVVFTGANENGGLAGLRGFTEGIKGKTDFPLSTVVLRWTPQGFQIAR